MGAAQQTYSKKFLNVPRPTALYSIMITLTGVDAQTPIEALPHGPEQCHGKLDELMFKSLSALGFGAGVSKIQKTKLWYA